MSRIIKTQIDGVPVTLELLQVGPAESEQIEKLSENLAKEERDTNSNVVTTNTKFRVVSIGDDTTPATEEQKKSVESRVEKENAAELLGELIGNINALPSAKLWYQSRTVWVNIIAIIISTATYFGLDIKADPELILTVASIIIGGINLFLRTSSKTPIANIAPIIKK